MKKGSGEIVKKGNGEVMKKGSGEIVSGEVMKEESEEFSLLSSPNKMKEGRKEKEELASSPLFLPLHLHLQQLQPQPPSFPLLSRSSANSSPSSPPITSLSRSSGASGNGSGGSDSPSSPTSSESFHSHGGGDVLEQLLHKYKLREVGEEIEREGVVELVDLRLSLDDSSKSLILLSLFSQPSLTPPLLLLLRDSLKLKEVEKITPSLLSFLSHSSLLLPTIFHAIKEEIKDSKRFQPFFFSTLFFSTLFLNCSLGTLFRGNSMASKLIKEYVPRVAMNYLRIVFEEPFSYIFSQNKNLEVLLFSSYFPSSFLLLSFFLLSFFLLSFNKFVFLGEKDRSKQDGRRRKSGREDRGEAERAVSNM